MKKQEMLKEMFDTQWRIKPLHKGEVFNYDGIVNEDIWGNFNSKKLMFFLKEAHQRNQNREEYGKDTFDLTCWLNGGVHKMWKKVAIWTAAIEDTTRDSICLYDEADIRRREQELIREISVVNVKKSKGYTRSEWEELVSYVQEDKELLAKEIEIISPKIIICGNNCSLLKMVWNGALDLERLNREKYLIHKGCIIIDYYHPANQYPNFVNYYAIAAIYQQALRNI